MYTWLFNALPGPVWVRLVLLLSLAAAVILCLLLVVFPWIDSMSPTEVTIDQG